MPNVLDRWLRNALLIRFVIVPMGAVLIFATFFKGSVFRFLTVSGWLETFKRRRLPYCSLPGNIYICIYHVHMWGLTGVNKRVAFYRSRSRTSRSLFQNCRPSFMTGHIVIPKCWNLSYRLVYRACSKEAPVILFSRRGRLLLLFYYCHEFCIRCNNIPFYRDIITQQWGLSLANALIHT